MGTTCGAVSLCCPKTDPPDPPDPGTCDMSIVTTEQMYERQFPAGLVLFGFVNRILPTVDDQEVFLVRICVQSGVDNFESYIINWSLTPPAWMPTVSVPPTNNINVPPNTLVCIDFEFQYLADNLPTIDDYPRCCWPYEPFPTAGGWLVRIDAKPEIGFPNPDVFYEVEWRVCGTPVAPTAMTPRAERKNPRKSAGG